MGVMDVMHLVQHQLEQAVEILDLSRVIAARALP